jgi:ankyrin repeat protein
LIQAACAGDLDIFKMLMPKVRPFFNLFEFGPICLSKKRKNLVSGTVLHAACYHGHPELAKFLIDQAAKSTKDQVNLACKEERDLSQKSGY